jgi:hypothetical protein
MPKIRLILIALFGMFLLGCASGGKRNSTFTQKTNVINCGKNAKVINSECFEAQAKVQEARRKARRKSDHDSWCGTACLSAKQKKREELLKARKKKWEYSDWCGTACLSGRQKARLEGKSGLMGEWIGDNWYERQADSFRLRSMSGANTFETAEATNKSYALILNRWGLGQTIEESSELYPDDIVVTTKSQYLDFSYTFNLSDTTGDSLTLTIGAGAPRGELKVTKSTNTYRSNSVSGAGYFAVLGIELWIFELLAGYRVSNIKYTGLGSTDTDIDDLEGGYSMKGHQSMIGFGISL